MNTLQIQDAFQPYYAGCNDRGDCPDPASSGRQPIEAGLDQRRAAQRIKDGLSASRRERRQEDQA